jgi:hypothetical protein
MNIKSPFFNDFRGGFRFGGIMLLISLICFAIVQTATFKAGFEYWCYILLVLAVCGSGFSVLFLLCFFLLWKIDKGEREVRKNISIAGLSQAIVPNAFTAFCFAFYHLAINVVLFVVLFKADYPDPRFFKIIIAFPCGMLFLNLFLFGGAFALWKIERLRKQHDRAVKLGADDLIHTTETPDKPDESRAYLIRAGLVTEGVAVCNAKNEHGVLCVLDYDHSGLHRGFQNNIPVGLPRFYFNDEENR